MITWSQAVRFVVSLLAAYFFIDAGGEMSDIRSVAGTTIDEAFYQAFGTLSYGLAALSVVIGLPAIPRIGGTKSSDSPAPIADVPEAPDDADSAPIADVPEAPDDADSRPSGTGYGLYDEPDETR